MQISSIFGSTSDSTVTVESLIKKVVGNLLSEDLVSELRIKTNESLTSNKDEAVVFNFSDYAEGSSLLNPTLTINKSAFKNMSPQPARKLLVVDKSVSENTKDFIYSLIGEVAAYQYHSLISKYELVNTSQAYDGAIKDKSNTKNQFMELSALDKEISFIANFQMVSFNRIVNSLTENEVTVLEKELK